MNSIWVPLLNQRWSLHDVGDVEALLIRAVSRSRYADGLRPDERDDLVTYLFEFAWKLSQKFDPERGSFAVFLYGAAQRRIIDWHRSRYPPAGPSRIASTNGSSPSSSHSTTATMVVNWEGLSKRGAALMRQVGIPASEGYSERQIATELQTSKSWVSEALGELQAELRRLG